MSDKQWMTGDEVLKFSIREGELVMEDTETKDFVVVAVDVEGIDEVIKILEIMKPEMKLACDASASEEDSEEDDEEDEVESEEDDSDIDEEEGDDE